MEAQEDEKIIVHSLIGVSQLPFYLGCLKSIVAFCQDRIELQLHTDGSLSREYKDFIHSELTGTMVTIPDYSENKSRVLDCLQGRPNCQKVRNDSIWGIEFFDPIYAFPEDPISFYIDADILFLRPFSGLFERNQVKGGLFSLKTVSGMPIVFVLGKCLQAKKNLKQLRGSLQDLYFGIKRQSTGITSSGFWAKIIYIRSLNGLCPLPRLVWPIDVRQKRFVQDKFQTFIPTPKFMKTPLGYICLDPIGRNGWKSLKPENIIK